LGFLDVFGLSLLARSPDIKRRVKTKELIQFMKTCEDKNACERAIAITLLIVGFSEKEVADMLDRNERTVRNWLTKWNEFSFDGLLKKGGTSKTLVALRAVAYCLQRGI